MGCPAGSLTGLHSETCCIMERMDFPDIFKSLSIDTWYKALMCIGGVVLTLSIFLPTHGLTVNVWQLLSGGTFFIGLGEWKNHKMFTFIKPPNAYTGPPAVMSGIMRKPDMLGSFFTLAGVALIMLGIWKSIRG